MYIEDRINMIKETDEFYEKNTNIVSEEIFMELILNLNKCLNCLNLKKEDVILYYERYENKSSLLTIKLKKETNEDIKNCVFIVCYPYYSKEIFCNIQMYSTSGYEAINIVNLLSKYIVNFFDKIETSLKFKKCENIQISKDLSSYLQKENELIKTLLKKEERKI